MPVVPGEQAALLDLDEVVPRPDLAAVRVPRELEVDAVLRRAPHLARLVREQHERVVGVALRGAIRSGDRRFA